MSDFFDLREWVGELAAAVSRLSSEQLLILAPTFRENEVVPGPSAAQLQRKLSISAMDAASLTRSLRRVFDTRRIEGRDIEVALITLAHARSLADARHERVEVVCTAPNGLGVPVRTTFAVATEMVQAASQELFLVGYVFTQGARDLILQCAIGRRDRDIKVTIVGNQTGQQVSMLKSLWPADCPPPNLYVRTADSMQDITSLHAKLLICDRTVALVTSANFSYQGLHENIEIGVKIYSHAVNRLVEFVEAMIKTGAVQPINWCPKRIGH